MDEILRRIQKIKQCLEDSDEEPDDTKNKKAKRQSKKSSSNNNSSSHQSNKTKKQKKSEKPKEVIKFNDNISNQEDEMVLNIEEIKEMHQRMQNHLVNLTKIQIKDQSSKLLFQEMASNESQSSSRSPKKSKNDKKVVKNNTKEISPKKIKNVKKVAVNEKIPSKRLDLKTEDESIPLPADFPDIKSTSATFGSSFSINENNYHYRPKSNSTFNLESFMNGSATRSILKNSPVSSETSSNFNSKSDLKTTDLISVDSLIDEARKLKRAHFSSDDDHIPGEILLISSDNKDVYPQNSDDSDIVGVPFIPQDYSGPVKIDDDFNHSFSSADDDFHDENLDNNYNDIEIDEELKARYLDNTNIVGFSAAESPILKGVKDFDFGDDIDVQNFCDVGSDEDNHLSLDDLY